MPDFNAYINVFMTMDTLAPCAHHVTPSAEYPAYPRTYSDDKRKANASYGLSTVEGIQEDMIQYGSVTSAFTVYEDFPTYTSGVYHHVNTDRDGTHDVRVHGSS